MKNKKLKYIVGTILITALCTTGCSAKLSDGNKTIVKLDKTSISADELYKELKEKYAINIIVDQIDHKLFDTKYKSDSNEKKSIDAEISQIKETYNTETTFNTVIQQYFGVKDEEELRKVLSLEYKRNLAVKEYIKENLTDNEIQTYYDTKKIGDIKASHILIKSTANESDSDEEKSKKEEEAKKKAEEIIKKLENGENFAKLAKKYSDDSGTAKDGGNLGYFNKNDNLDENFVNAAAILKVNEYTKEPVKTQYGYHIILKVKEKDKPKLDKVKEEIKTNLTKEKLEEDSTLHYKTLIKIREKSGIKFKDTQIKKAYNELMDKLTNNTNTNSN